MQPVIDSVISLYESGTNNILTGSSWCLTVGTVAENKTNNGVTNWAF